MTITLYTFENADGNAVDFSQWAVGTLDYYDAQSFAIENNYRCYASEIEPAEMHADREAIWDYTAQDAEPSSSTLDYAASVFRRKPRS